MRTLKFSTRFKAFLICQLEYLIAPIFLAAYFLTDVFPLVIVAVVFLEQRACQLYFDWRDRAIFAGKILDAIEEAEKATKEGEDD